jgi:pimeloyl-ACP methyl ester carboxylesterase
LLFDHLLRNDFIYWAFITYLRPVMQRVVGVPKGFTLTPELAAAVQVNLAATLPASQRMDGMIFDTYHSSAEFYEEISDDSPYSVNKIETPVLLINALDDPLAVPENVRGMAEKFPNAHLYIVPDGGHMLLGHSKEVNAQITQFLWRLPGLLYRQPGETRRYPSLASKPNN